MKQVKKQQDQEMTVVKGGKEIPFRTHPSDENFNTGALIRILLDYMPKDDPSYSVTTSQMRERFKILDAVEARHKDSTVINLSEEQVKLLADISPKIPWKIVDKFIVDFEDSLK